MLLSSRVPLFPTFTKVNDVSLCVRLTNNKIELRLSCHINSEKSLFYQLGAGDQASRVPLKTVKSASKISIHNNIENADENWDPIQTHIRVLKPLPEHNSNTCTEQMSHCFYYLVQTQTECVMLFLHTEEWQKYSRFKSSRHCISKCISEDSILHPFPVCALIY